MYEYNRVCVTVSVCGNSAQRTLVGRMKIKYIDGSRVGRYPWLIRVEVVFISFMMLPRAITNQYLKFRWKNICNVNLSRDFNIIVGGGGNPYREA